MGSVGQTGGCGGPTGLFGGRKSWDTLFHTLFLTLVSWVLGEMDLRSAGRHTRLPWHLLPKPGGCPLQV